MQFSTAAELAGFALLSVAAWMLCPIAGVAVAGGSLLLVGYATDDTQVAVSARRMVAPLGRWREKRRARRAEKRSKDG